MRRSGERGFTLLELVLALSIVALMLTVLFGGLRVSLRAWQRGEERAESLQHERSVIRLVEQALAGAHTFQGQTDQNSQPQGVFKGEAERGSFVTVSPPMPLPAPIAFTALTLSVDAGASPGLAIREKALPNFNPFEAVAPSVVDPSISAIRFRYLRDVGQSAAVWDGAEEKTLPRAIEAALTAQINGRAQQILITVPIRVTSP